MTSELDDVKEFVEATDAFNEMPIRKLSDNSHAVSPKSLAAESNQRVVNPGQVTQYALYGGGYTATTPTVDRLPTDCYDIFADSHCIYVSPALKPSGILLELPEMRSDDVIKVVETFWNSEDDYKNGNEFIVGGARYATGLLIYGPPGSGKSCTIKIVSNKLLQRDGIVFYASSSPQVVTSFLTDFAKIEKNRKSIVILEDIDSLIQTYGESSYLEMLDSAKSINNVVFIATTNYPEKLDPRIYNRPGRFPHVMKIGLPGAKAREAYLRAILKNHRDVNDIVEKSEGFTIDHLTALVNAVYREKKNLNNEIMRLRTLYKMPKSSEQRPMGIESDWKENT